MDGTFKSASNSFYQVYIIHGEFGGQSFPLIYCFLSNKTEETYIKVFDAIKSTLATKSIKFSHAVIQIDFEVLAYNAIRQCFPHYRITGCFFHFGQAICRRVQKLGLVTLYNDNVHFAELVETISTIALVPLDAIDIAWNVIKNQFTYYNTNVQSLLIYVERNWLCNTRPLYDREIWSHYGTLRGRTNNAAEGFHSKLYKLVNKVNTSFLQVFYTIKAVQMLNQVELNRLFGGGESRRRNKKYIKQEKRIEKLWGLYRDGLISLRELIDGLKGAIKLNS